MKLRELISVILSVLCVGCSSVAVTPPSDPPPEVTAEEAARESFGPYRMRGGDVLEVIYQTRVRKIDRYVLSIRDVVELRYVSLPEMTHEQTVRSDGYLTLPLAGEVYVLGMTPAAANAKIRRAYQGVLRDPDVVLLIKESGAAVNELKRVISSSSRGQSKLLTIRPDGVVTLPVIGDVSAVGRTIPELTEDVNNRYQELFQELAVNILLHSTADQSVFVLGEVHKPGAYTIFRPLTVGQALAMAGGINHESRLNDVILVRREDDKVTATRVDFKAVLEGSQQQVPVLLRPDDVVFVPRRKLASTSQAIEDVARLLMFRGFSYDLNDN